MVEQSRPVAVIVPVIGGVRHFEGIACILFRRGLLKSDPAVAVIIIMLFNGLAGAALLGHGLPLDPSGRVALVIRFPLDLRGCIVYRRTFPDILPPQPAVAAVFIARRLGLHDRAVGAPHLYPLRLEPAVVIVIVGDCLRMDLCAGCTACPLRNAVDQLRVEAFPRNKRHGLIKTVFKPFIPGFAPVAPVVDQGLDPRVRIIKLRISGGAVLLAQEEGEVLQRCLVRICQFEQVKRHRRDRIIELSNESFDRLHQFREFIEGRIFQDILISCLHETQDPIDICLCRLVGCSPRLDDFIPGKDIPLPLRIPHTAEVLMPFL